MTANKKVLAFRLRASVRYYLLEENRPVLILFFPLKIVYLHPFWRPVLNIFTKGEFIPFEDILALIPETPPEKIESFLKDLIRKGFAEQQGIPVMAENEYPFVSVIVPVRNRPREIEDCLNSLEKLDYPASKKEIIVIDDASEDDTFLVIAQFPVRLIRLGQRKQASFCRNLGARNAKGAILAFIDSDCLADPLWLRELTPAFKDVTLGAVGGLIDAYYDTKGLDHYEKVKSALKISSWFKRSETEDRFFYVPACNFLVRKNLFLKLDGFRESLYVGEDVDFCWRLQNHGNMLEYWPAGKIFHKHRNRLRPFCARRFDYGTSEPLLQQLHPDRVKRLFFPPSAALFWIIFISALFFKSAILFILAPGILTSDCINKYRKIRSRKIPIHFLRLSQAVFRSYLTLVFHCCSFMSRYYLIPALLLLPLNPSIPAVISCMHLLVGITEYRIKKPHINPLSFLFYFSLEQLSYQAGVWQGCFKRWNFNAVLPGIMFKKEK
ncbi:mycofactocin biosynthesis glycosyltransferase MftF [Desulfococcaceae bacterium HSG7]|nr:mycofactocin biosynthesis glycosyltransferase MftF [Desulfococcaceae bacterium HSG7]